jgi:hypothetical protein
MSLLPQFLIQWRGSFSDSWRRSPPIRAKTANAAVVKFKRTHKSLVRKYGSNLQVLTQAVEPLRTNPRSHTILVRVPRSRVIIERDGTVKLRVPKKRSRRR